MGTSEAVAAVALSEAVEASEEALAVVDSVAAAAASAAATGEVETAVAKDPRDPKVFAVDQEVVGDDPNYFSQVRIDLIRVSSVTDGVTSPGLLAGRVPHQSKYFCEVNDLSFIRFMFSYLAFCSHLIER